MIASFNISKTKLPKKMQLGSMKRNAPMADKFITLSHQVIENNNAHKHDNGTANGDLVTPSTTMAMNNAVLNCRVNPSTDSGGMHGGTYQESTESSKDNTRLLFNVCGDRFVTLASTLDRFPNTLLGDAEKRQRLWDPDQNEYYLDRNRACFESMLTYYQSNGIIIRPANIPDVLFVRELRFYELGEDVIQKITRDGGGQDSQHLDPTPKHKTPDNKLQQKIWYLFEYPETSKGAKCIAWLSCSVVVFSIVLFCAETLPRFKTDDSNEENDSHETFFILEAICIAWFTLEYVTRLVSSPNKWIFVKGPLNIIDLVAILPFFLTFAFASGSNVSSLAILRAIRLVRVFRIFKLSRYSTGLQILGMTLRASLSELGLLVFFLCVGVILFASAIYYAEMDVADGGFNSIPHSFWWAIVTMTTVGYGDMYPTTLAGKIIGSACACTGILAIALPVPVIVANFERFYSTAMKQAQNCSDEKVNKKADKYKALKRFFDKIRQRNNSPGDQGAISDDHYYDMADVFPGEEVKTDSNDNCQDSLLLEKTVVLTSNV